MEMLSINLNGTLLDEALACIKVLEVVHGNDPGIDEANVLNSLLDDAILE